MVDIFVNSSTPPDGPPIIPEKAPTTENQKIKLENHSHNPLSSFCLYPDFAQFETREKDERIVLLLRQHPIINIKWILISFLMFFVPGIISNFGVFNAFPVGFELVFSLIWYLITVAYALENFLSWYFNVYFVTDRRVIDVDFYNLIYKQVSDAQLSKIEDVTYNMGGVVRTLFNYGNVFIQTAAEVSEFEFLAVPSPDKVAKIIQDLMTP